MNQISLDLEEISCSVSKDSLYVAKLAGMIFTTKEMLSCSVTGKPNRNPAKKKVSQIKLNTCKVDFVTKMLSIQISKDYDNLNFHQDRLQKVRQHLNTKVQNMRKLQERKI